MQAAALRRWTYFTLVSMRGQHLAHYYWRYRQETRAGIPPGTTSHLLARLLEHCCQSVPYYAEQMRRTPGGFHEDPFAYLRSLPILTKDIIRTRFEDLKSVDLPKRKYYCNTSGGSTGEPVRLIQDWDFAAQAGAISLLFSSLVGREVGEPEVKLWGSEREIRQGSEHMRARFINTMTNTLILNAFRMNEEDMCHYIDAMNRRRPRILVAYAQSLYELAMFAERKQLRVLPPAAIIASATMLYPHMRRTIETVFQCRVFNRYGSREVGDIACERPGCTGMWVAPWGNYLEIVDQNGERVPDGCDGEILITSLTNYAMPLVRYKIGDIGALAPLHQDNCAQSAQVLQSLLGRSEDTFRNRAGALIDPGYFEGLLYYKDWLRRFQVIQKTTSHIVFRIVRTDAVLPDGELDEIRWRTRQIMGADCEVSFDFVEEIQPSSSGKFRYEICELPH